MNYQQVQSAMFEAWCAFYDVLDKYFTEEQLDKFDKLLDSKDAYKAFLDATSEAFVTEQEG